MTVFVAVYKGGETIEVFATVEAALVWAGGVEWAMTNDRLTGGEWVIYERTVWGEGAKEQSSGS